MSLGFKRLTTYHPCSAERQENPGS